MAKAFIKKFVPDWKVFSAGTKPEKEVNPYAVSVMKEKGIDISKNQTKSVNKFLKDEFDYVITVCSEADKNCPAFYGKVKHKLHIGFNDPAKVIGSEKYILSEFRRVRDEIERDFQNLIVNLK